MSFFGTTAANTDTVAHSFLDFYYGSVASKGWNATLSGYDETCTCSVNGVNNKPFDFVTTLATEGIARGTLDSPLATWKHTGDNLLVTVSSGITFVSFAGHQISRKMLVDNFIISVSKCKILDHTMHVR